MPNVFGIADDILVIGYNKDRADHDEAVYLVLKWCQDINLKLNKDECHFRCMSILLFGKVVSREGNPTRSAENQSTDQNASAKEQKGAAVLLRHN